MSSDKPEPLDDRTDLPESGEARSDAVGGTIRLSGTGNPAAEIADSAATAHAQVTSTTASPPTPAASQGPSANPIAAYAAGSESDLRDAARRLDPAESAPWTAYVDAAMAATAGRMAGRDARVRRLLEPRRGPWHSLTDAVLAGLVPTLSRSVSRDLDPLSDWSTSAMRRLQEASSESAANVARLQEIETLRVELAAKREEVGRLRDAADLEAGRRVEAERERSTLASEAEKLLAKLTAVTEELARDTELRVYRDALPESLEHAAARLRDHGDRPCQAFVLSVDVRHSTALMLHAADPRKFATFLVELCTGLRDVVHKNYGVFDKFTGDGILAFFPEDLCGDDAWYFALSAATACHAEFGRVFDAYQGIFRCRPADRGLGIGIDYGPASLISDLGTLTMVGAPVVYACRLGGAPARSTYVNVQAYERVAMFTQGDFKFDPVVVEVKHELPMDAYRAVRVAEQYRPRRPSSDGPDPARDAQRP